ncbi:hypothetical protein CPSG_05663 [Coccidioides posadasii str. Silveira]|uniref:Uncharacterized protein n=1 Tax=Coccidioides posadasii (strain RMSCC 757 / Silveira) TaxID=443226 RepID=E9D704_COCPS|nr:hypothetical protein CPSG_05663 [Coccidioides posadasii str. Silveira]
MACVGRYQRRYCYDFHDQGSGSYHIKRSRDSSTCPTRIEPNQTTDQILGRLFWNLRVPGAYASKLAVDFAQCWNFLPTFLEGVHTAYPQPSEAVIDSEGVGVEEPGQTPYRIPPTNPLCQLDCHSLTSAELWAMSSHPQLLLLPHTRATMHFFLNSADTIISYSVDYPLDDYPRHSKAKFRGTNNVSPYQRQ